MLSCVILSDGNVLIGILQYSPTVVVHIEIVRRREYSDDRRKLFRRRFAEHDISVGERKDGAVALDLNIPGILCFMSSDDAKETIPLQELDDRLIPAIQLDVSHSVHS